MAFTPGNPDLAESIAQSGLRQVRDTPPSKFLDKLVKNYPIESIKSAMRTSAQLALINSGNDPETLLRESPRFATKIVGDLGIRLTAHIDGDYVGPPTHQYDNGEIYGIGIEVFQGKIYDQKSVLYEALWSCPAISTPHSPFIVNESGQQVDMNELFSAADGFVDWRNPKKDPNLKKYSLHNLREREEIIRSSNKDGIATVDDYLADQEWQEISAGIWQGYRLLAANLLSWNKNKIVMPADLKVKFLPKPLDNIALDAYRS